MSGYWKWLHVLRYGVHRYAMPSDAMQ